MIQLVVRLLSEMWFGNVLLP